MNTLILRVGLLALALGGTFIIAPLLQGPERRWSFVYNTAGLLESMDGPRTDVNDITRYEYDMNGNLTHVANALGHITEFSNFNFTGNPQTIIDPNGLTTTLTYASQGWLTSVSTANNTIRFKHNAVGDVTEVTLGDGSWLAYSWDDSRRLVRINNNLEDSVQFDLDPMGNRTATQLKDKVGNLTKQHQWIYDELGRLLYSVGSAGQTSRIQYDLNNNPVSSVTPRAYSDSRAYDSLDRLVKSTDSLNGATHFEYDDQNNLTQVRDPRGVFTQYLYDGLGNLIQLDSPDSGTSSYKYDGAGNITQRTDARGVITSFTYDALNRLTARLYPSNPELDTRFLYDSTAADNKGVGRLTAVEDINGVLNYIYDAKGNLTAQLHIPPADKTTQLDNIGYGYDGAHRLNRIDYPTGFSLDYLRDSAGLIRQVQIRRGAGKPVKFAHSMTYLPFGPLKNLTWNNGNTLQRTYDQDYRLTAQTVAHWSTSYSYDPNSNVTQIKSNLLGNLNYTYDALDRLAEESNDSQQTSFTYDAVGNRTHRTATHQVERKEQEHLGTVYRYGVNHNRLIQIDDQLMSTDAAGNLTLDRSNRQIAYDEENRMSSVTKDDKLLVRFRYNARGQRIQKITTQSVTTFLYGMDGRLLGETLFDSNGKKLTSQYYFWLEDLPLGGVTVTYGTGGTILDSVPFYIHSDHLNTPRIATDASRNTIWKWKSDAFGVGDAEGPLALNLRFPGQYYDVETDLHYNYFRDYDPKTGRYLESDPIGLKGGLNTYSYANENPTKYIDPLGLESIFEWSAKAEAEAKRSMLPGEHNGPQDAYRHCTASCMIASSNWGATTSRFAGWANEASNFGQGPSERAMDDWNNQAGICAAKGNSSPEDCTKKCMTLLNKGSLTTNASSEGAYY